jgi:hypothetical protein
LKDIYGQTLEHDYSDQPIEFYVKEFDSSSFGMLSGESGITQQIEFKKKKLDFYFRYNYNGSWFIR